ncbi:MAG: hypothetical protein JXA13_12425 [Anaerolineales bacterium]|nr:hypothetical protein [Anaerolineales bacterium]
MESLFPFIAFLSGTILVFMFVFASAIRIVPEYQRLRVYRLGRDIGLKGPGLIFLIPFIDRGIEIDLGGPETGRGIEDPGPVAAGALGETQGSVHRDGTVRIGDRSWPAVSEYPIAPNSRVRVRRVIVEVEEE